MTDKLPLETTEDPRAGPDGLLGRLRGSLAMITRYREAAASADRFRYAVAHALMIDDLARHHLLPESAMTLVADCEVKPSVILLPTGIPGHLAEFDVKDLDGK